MQPQDGLEITVFIPAFLIPVIVLLLIGVIGGAGVAAWRHRQRQQRRADELRAAKAAELAGGPHEANPTTDAYRNFIRDISHEISNPL